MQFTFDVKALSTVYVEAETEEDARKVLRRTGFVWSPSLHGKDFVECGDIDLDGEPILASVEAYSFDDEKPETQGVLVVSTAHMPDPGGVDVPNCGPDIRTENHEYGYLAFLGDVEEKAVPPWLRPLFRSAREQDCQMIMWDRDGKVYANFPRWTW